MFRSTFIITDDRLSEPISGSNGGSSSFFSANNIRLNKTVIISNLNLCKPFCSNKIYRSKSFYATNVCQIMHSKLSTYIILWLFKTTLLLHTTELSFFHRFFMHFTLLSVTVVLLIPNVQEKLFQKHFTNIWNTFSHFRTYFLIIDRLCILRFIYSSIYNDFNTNFYSFCSTDF